MSIAPNSPIRFPQAVPLAKNVNDRSLAISADRSSEGEWVVAILGDSVSLETIHQACDEYVAKSNGIPFKNFCLSGMSSPTQLAVVRHFREKTMWEKDLDQMSLARQFQALYNRNFHNRTSPDTSGKLKLYIAPTGQTSTRSDTAELISDQERKEAHAAIKRKELEDKGFKLVQPDEIAGRHPAVDRKW